MQTMIDNLYNKGIMPLHVHRTCDPLWPEKGNHFCARRLESNTQPSNVFKDRWVVAWSVQSVLAYDHTRNRDEQMHAQLQEDSQS